MQIYKDLVQWTPEWHRIRAGVITWTWLTHLLKGWRNLDWDLSSVAKKAMNNYIYELLWWEFSYDEEAPEKSTYLMDKWHILEEEAKIVYSRDFKVNWTNIWFIKKNERLWLSPDWVIYEWDKIKKAVEIKCPLGNNSKNFFKYKFEHKIPDEYLPQVLQYFLVIDELEELDFMVYNPNLVIWKKYWIKTVKRADIQEELLDAQQRIQEARKIWENYIKLLIN